MSEVMFKDELERVEKIKADIEEELGQNQDRFTDDIVEEKPQANMIDLLLAKNINEFKVKSCKVEIPRLSEILGEKFVIELRVLSSAVEDAIDERSIILEYDEDGKPDIDIKSTQQKLDTLIEASYTPDGKQLFKNAQLRKKFGVRTNQDLVRKMLLEGEIDKVYNRYRVLTGHIKTSVVDIKN